MHSLQRSGNWIPSRNLVGGWFCLSPDGSLVLMRWLPAMAAGIASEIWSLARLLY
jgi:hypothetical protein